MLREIERLTRQKLPVAGGDPGPEHHHGSRDYRPRGNGGGRPANGNRFRFQKRSSSGTPPAHGGYGGNGGHGGHGGKRPAKQRRFSRA